MKRRKTLYILTYAAYGLGHMYSYSYPYENEEEVIEAFTHKVESLKNEMNAGGMSIYSLRKCIGGNETLDDTKPYVVMNDIAGNYFRVDIFRTKFKDKVPDGGIEVHYEMQCIEWEDESIDEEEILKCAEKEARSLYDKVKDESNYDFWRECYESYKSGCEKILGLMGFCRTRNWYK